MEEDNSPIPPSHFFQNFPSNFSTPEQIQSPSFKFPFSESPDYQNLDQDISQFENDHVFSKTSNIQENLSFERSIPFLDLVQEGLRIANIDQEHGDEIFDSRKQYLLRFDTNKKKHLAFQRWKKNWTSL